MIDSNDVFIRNDIKTKYNNIKNFNPGNFYPEFDNWNIKIESDYVVYDEIRNLLLDMKLDEKNIGTNKWNPFKDFIKEGDQVLIKPNLVRHKNPSPFGSLKSTITNYSVIRPILDYTIKAIGTSGKIIIADAPVQECDFEKLLSKSKLEYLISNYTNIKNIQLYDLRKNQNANVNTVSIDLGSKSFFCDNSLKNKEYLISNYSDNIMKKNHNNNHHIYITSDIVLESDVIINVFKPKCHRIAGLTASMKNLIGTISKKECLPHYSHGSIKDNGDEYPYLSNYRKFCYKIFNKKSKYMIPFQLFLKTFNQLIPDKSTINGCWYKNDTIWRTILDVNNIIDFSNKKGKLSFDKKQRIIFNIGDMIISGEKNGPLHPRDKYVGCLVAGFNRNSIDNVICDAMGFEKEYIRYLINNQNYKLYINGLKSETIKNYKFKPADGWSIVKKN